MQRIYYSINEEAAKQAHDMMSMSNYQTGSRTNEYRSYVDRAYDLAEAAAKERPDEADRIRSLAEMYSKRMAENMNEASRIGCMCPSILITGAGNFPARKKEKQNLASDRNYAEFRKIQGILEKIESIRRGKDIIKSGDSDAVEKLEKKLEGLKEAQEEMKAANRAVRMKDPEKGNAELARLGFSARQIEKLRTPDFCGRIGFSDYTLRNNNANIRRIEERLTELRKARETESRETEYGFCKVVEDTETMRIQLFFDGKPDPGVRDILKGNGFRWAPSRGAWQRQLTANGRYAAGHVIDELKKMEIVCG